MRWRSVSVVVAAAMVVLAGALMVPNRASAAWQAQPSGTSLELLAVAFGDPAHGWVTTRVDGSSRNHILATGDGGGSWHPQSYAGYREALWDVAFADASHGWAVGSWNWSEAEGGTIVGTSDGGKHWRKLYSPTGSEYGSGYVYGVACSGRSRVWVVGCNMIAATVNGGATWRVQRRWRSSSGANNVLWDICFTDRSCGWTVGNRCLLYTSDAADE